MLAHSRAKHPDKYTEAVEAFDKEAADGGSSSVSSASASASQLKTPSQLKSSARSKGREISSFLDSKIGPPWDATSAKSKKMNEAVLKMIVLDNQPFSIVDQHVGFIELVGLLEPRYIVPGRTHIRGLLAPKAELVRTQVMDVLEEANYVAFTSDIWTDKLTVRSFISLSAHWIDEGWELQSYVLHASWFAARHSAVEIGDKLLKMMATWKIGKRRRSVMVRDGAINMRKGCRLASLPAVHCTIHLLQLVIKDAIFSQSAVKTIITKARRLVSHLNHSSSQTEVFKQLQDSVPEAKRKKLHQDVVTRWNSTYMMLERFLELKHYVIQYLVDSESAAVPHFTSDEWTIMKRVITILEPFFIITKQLSGDLVTLGTVIPRIEILVRKVRKVDSSRVGTFKADILEALTDRFYNPLVEENLTFDTTGPLPLNIRRCHFYTIPTLLDPRWKFLLEGRERDEAKALVVKLLLETTPLQTASSSASTPSSSQLAASSAEQEDEHECQITSPPPSASSATTSAASASLFQPVASQPLASQPPGQIGHPAIELDMEEELDALLSEAAPADMVVGGPAVYTDAMKLHELDTYFSESYVDKKENPLQYWKKNARKFPTLSIIARKYCCIPASSVYSERLFSEFGNVYDRRRSCLKPDCAEDLVFLHHNLTRLENKGKKPLQTKPDTCEEFEAADTEDPLFVEDEHDLIAAEADDEDDST
jgi:hypothetical protein